MAPLSSGCGSNVSRMSSAAPRTVAARIASSARIACQRRAASSAPTFGSSAAASQAALDLTWRGSLSRAARVSRATLSLACRRGSCWRSWRSSRLPVALRRERLGLSGQPVRLCLGCRGSRGQVVWTCGRCGHVSTSVGRRWRWFGRRARASAPSARSARSARLAALVTGQGVVLGAWQERSRCTRRAHGRSTLPVRRRCPR